MAKYRDKLPQLSGGLFLTDGGLETDLIFQEGLDLPDMAAFHLLRTPEGRGALEKYFRPYAELAKKEGVGLILESATWRASRDWGEKRGLAADAMAEINRDSIAFFEPFRRDFETEKTPVVFSGCIGPRGDGYWPEKRMSAAAAQDYHRLQIGAFAGSEADMVSAITMNYVEEAIGIVQGAREAGLPAAVSFTVEIDGKLPTGQTLQAAIHEVDEVTGAWPAYYMVNCAHPTHFDKTLLSGESWVERIGGLRANASAKSHAELDESGELDEGNPEEFGRQYAELFHGVPSLRVLGGCCGTDLRHVQCGLEAVLRSPLIVSSRGRVKP